MKMGTCCSLISVVILTFGISAFKHAVLAKGKGCRRYPCVSPCLQ
jgi:hypothetical protein